MLHIANFLFTILASVVAIEIHQNFEIGLWWAIAIMVLPLVGVLRIAMPDRYESLRLLRPELTIRSVFMLVILTWLLNWVEV